MMNYEKANKHRQKCAEMVTELVKKAGFMPAGWTEERIIGHDKEGKPIVTPSRKRFSKPHSDVRVTIGMKIIYFYKIEDGNTVEIASFDTTKTNVISRYLVQTKF